MDFQNSDRLLGDSLREAWELFSRNAVLFVLAGLVHAALSFVTLGILAPALTVGMIEMVQRRRAGEVLAVGDIFSGFSSFADSFIAGLIMAVLVGVGFLLFVLPGFVLFSGWLFVFPAIAVDRMGAMEAMAHSWDLFRAQVPLTFVLAVLVLVTNSIGTGVLLGVALTFPLTAISVTIMYEKLRGAADVPHGSNTPEMEQHP